LVGTPTVVESNSLDGARGVVFEDDGETGYFYALDFRSGDQPIVDALHIYSVVGVKDASIPSTIRIVWSNNWLKSALLINDMPHAMFDFADKVGYSRDRFPDPDSKSEWGREEWREDLQEHFYK
jgi:hypothetical protein